MRILTVIFAVLLSGCASINSLLPSFWDDNQSRYIIEARASAEAIDCGQAQTPQVQRVDSELAKFLLYSQAKGRSQSDVISLVEPIKATTSEWLKRGEGSRVYCEIKRRLVIQETHRAAEVILGRW